MAKWAAVIGSPIDHSLSPVLHGEAYRLLGLPWDYYRIDVDHQQLESFMQQLDRDCVGLSVTAPLKRDVRGFTDVADGLVKITGSANTVVFSGAMSAAFNTDVHGIVETLKPHVSPGEGTPVLFGTGATASSALAALRTLGYESVNLIGRSFHGPSNAFMVAGEVDMDARPIQLSRFDWVEDAVANAPLVISTIPPAVSTDLARSLSFRPRVVLLDVTYGRGTGLSEAVAAAGGIVTSPLAMLTYQGLAQVKLMTNEEVPFEPVYEAVRRAAQSR